MSSINTLRKVATAAVVGAAFFASSANAFTLVNHSGETTLQVAAGSGNVSAPGYEYAQNPGTFTFDYVGGLVKIVLEDTNPEGKTFSFKLFQGVDQIGAGSTTDTAAAFGPSFYYSLAAGTYKLVLSTESLSSASALISAVPVPGAALLFGTSVLGFLGLNKRRKS